jgi:uncharacterized protein YjbI with pentapeptide repeats
MSDNPAQEPSERPAPDGFALWPEYWKAQGMSWRTEPEIGRARQAYLAERRAVKPDIQQGIYPFKDIKLTRSDVEWLVATLESGGMRGPIDWYSEAQHARPGLDLRGADLRDVDLRFLPLSRVRCGLSFREWMTASPQQGELAAAHLERATLSLARLERAALGFSHLEGAVLQAVRFEGANLRSARLGGADLRLAFFDTATGLSEAHLVDETTRAARVADVRWGDVNLAVVDWRAVKDLGDEQEARRRHDIQGKRKNAKMRLAEYETAVRANRQLATALREQGLNEHADRFAYRGQLLQREVLRRQGQLGRAFGSWLLDVVAGYGYKPIRSVIAYVLIVGLFAGAYLFNARFAAPHLSWDEALVLSTSSFHGRGFFSSGISLGDTLARLAAGEAIIGLLIEITFIATFTQRFFAR